MNAENHANDHLIKAHEERMANTEKWCEKLECSLNTHGEELKSKASTRTVMWGVGILMAILGVIWYTVVDNGRTMSYVQRNQDLVLRELRITPVR